MEIYTITELLNIKEPKRYIEIKLHYKASIFLASASKEKLTIWNENGNTLIYTCDIKDVKGLGAEIRRCLEASIKGFTICSICHKELKKDEIELYWFAGRYCKECTTDEMRQSKQNDYSRLD